MTDEQMNRIIHEKIMGECWHEFDTSKSLTCIKCPDGFVIDGNPNYTTDLNAVALAEAKVIEMKGEKVLVQAVDRLLQRVSEPYLDKWEWALLERRMPARQRAEACLRAMDLWEME